jgi:hypothetical protein
MISIFVKILKRAYFGSLRYNPPGGYLPNRDNKTHSASGIQLKRAQAGPM